MTFAEEMQQIVEDMDSSRERRLSEIVDLNKETAEIRTNARAEILSFRSARKHDAAVTNRMLQNTVKANRKVVRGLRHDTRDTMAEIHAARVRTSQDTNEALKEFVDRLRRDVVNIRIDAHNMVNGFAEERLTRGMELSRMLKSHTEGITRDVGEMMDNYDRERSVVLAEIRGGQDVWQGHAGHEPVKARSPIKVIRPEPAQPARGSEDELKRRVLEVIRRSPNGISLAQAAKKLDIEWRKLVQPSKQLLNEDMIRKKESRYYPVT